MNIPLGAVAPRALHFRSKSCEHPDAAPEPRRRARQLRADEAVAVVDRYRELRNMRNVASEFQLSRTTVARMIKDHGVDASRKLIEPRIAVAVELNERGLSSATVGRRFGFDKHTVP